MQVSAGAVQVGRGRVVRLAKARVIVRRAQGVRFGYGFVCLPECVGARQSESVENASRMCVLRAVCSWEGGGVRMLMAAYVTSDTGSISEATGARERGPVLPIF